MTDEHINIPTGNIYEPITNFLMYSNKDIIEHHSLLHSVYDDLVKTKRDNVMGYTYDSVFLEHYYLVNEIFARGGHHRIKDELDRSNMPEDNARIYLWDVASYLRVPDIQLVKPFVYLVGGLCEVGWSDNDIDILIRQKDEDIPLQYRIRQLFPPYLQNRLHFLYDVDYYGSFSNCIPIFSKSLKVINHELHLDFMSKPNDCSTEKTSKKQHSRKSLTPEQKKLLYSLNHELANIHTKLNNTDYPDRSRLTEDQALSEMENIKPEMSDFKKVLWTSLVAFALMSFQRVYSDLGKDVPVDLPQNLMKKIEDYALATSTKLGNDITSNIQRTLKEGVLRGESDIDLKSRVSKIFSEGIETIIPAKYNEAGEIIKNEYIIRYSPDYRAEMIAQASTQRITADSLILGYRSNPDEITGWRWRTAEDDRVEEMCLALDGSEHSLDEEFDYPHPECRCYPEPIYKTDEESSKESYASEYPDESNKWRFVIQNHARGRSIHTDLRFQVDKDTLNGWTLFTEKPGIIKEEITKMGQLQSINSNWQKYLKINNNIGMDGIKLQAVKKKTMPLNWLTFKGVVEPGGPGSTDELPGVFGILDKGIIEYGVQKPDIKEYFLHGSKFNGRWIVSTVTRSDGSSLTLCWKPKDQVPYVLGPSAKTKLFVPPHGISALPSKWRNRIPKDLRWWEKNQTGVTARESIDKIRKMIRNNQLTCSRFSLKEISKEVYNLSITTQDNKVIEILTDKNPLLYHSMSATCDVFDEDHQSCFADSKELDSGDVEIINNKPNFLSLNFKGDLLIKYYLFSKKEGLSKGTFQETSLPRTVDILSDEMDKLVDTLKQFTVKDKIDQFLHNLSFHRYSAKHLTIKRDYTWPRTSEFPLPLKVSGLAIEAGTYTGMDGKTVTYKNQVIDNAVGIFTGVQFRKNHNEVDQSAVIGWVTKDWLEKSSDGSSQIWYDALVFDYESAKAIVDGKMPDVSVGVWNLEEDTPDGRMAIEIRKADEISSCENGAVGSAFAKPDLKASKQIQKVINS